MLSINKIQNSGVYNYTGMNNPQSEISFGARNKVATCVIKKSADSFTHLTKKGQEPLLPLYNKIEQNNEAAKGLQEKIDGYRETLNNVNTKLNNLEKEKQRKINQSKVYEIEQKRQKYIKSIKELESRQEKSTKAQAQAKFSKVEEQYNSAEHITKRLRNKFFRLKKTIEAPPRAKKEYGTGKIKVRIF